MNPDYSLADWVSNRGPSAPENLSARLDQYRGALIAAPNSTYPWLAFRDLGQKCACQICT
jgi:hypothetical protein